MEEQAQSVEDQIADILTGPIEDESEAPDDLDRAATRAAKDEAEAEPQDDDESPSEDDTEALTASDEDTESDTVEVEWEGQLFEAPKAIAEALMRNSDYTQKTQEVSTQRKQVEVALGEVERVKAEYEFAQSAQDDLLKIEQLKGQTEQARTYLRENLDSLSTTEIERIKFAISDAENEWSQLHNGLSTKTQEFQQAQEQSRKELLKKGTEVLRSRIPGWSQQQHAQQAAQYALSLGFTEQEVNSLVDPRQAEVLWKASRFDDLQQGKAAAVKKVQDAPTIKAKSRNPMPKETQQALNLRKKLKNPNLSSQDKAKLMEQDFGSRWA